ncbi:MAG: hypothetical protein JW874_03215 [Spirochaetales bacterium]|nr:hypothetical protein [Spirochaetales bacterium]
MKKVMVILFILSAAVSRADGPIDITINAAGYVPYLSGGFSASFLFMPWRNMITRRAWDHSGIGLSAGLFYSAFEYEDYYYDDYGHPETASLKIPIQLVFPSRFTLNDKLAIDLDAGFGLLLYEQMDFCASANVYLNLGRIRFGAGIMVYPFPIPNDLGLSNGDPQLYFGASFGYVFPLVRQ